jgi:hypothetical protein
MTIVIKEEVVASVVALANTMNDNKRSTVTEVSNQPVWSSHNQLLTK